jgi:LEA14-like dessication related protein
MSSPHSSSVLAASAPRFPQEAANGSRGWAALFFSAVIAGAACSTPQPPTVTPHLARIAAVSLEGLDLDVEVQVYNPNTFPLAAEAVSGTLFIGGGQKLGHGSSRPSHDIPASGSSMVQSRVHVDWDDLSALAPFMTADTLPYDFRGDVTLGGKSIHVTVPFTLSGHLTRTQLLQAGLRGL